MKIILYGGFLRENPYTTCPDCGAIRDRNKGGFTTARCAECVKKARAAETRARKKAAKKADPEAFRARKRAEEQRARDKDPEKVKAKRRERYQRHRDSTLKVNARWRENNAEYCRLKRQQYTAEGRFDQGQARSLVKHSFGLDPSVPEVKEVVDTMVALRRLNRQIKTTPKVCEI